MEVIKSGIELLKTSLLRIEASVRSLSGIYDSEDRLIGDNGKFWNSSDDMSFKSNSHWRGHGPFADNDLWRTIGERHRLLVKRAAAWAGLSVPFSTVVEWGCGGGMNAVAFAEVSQNYYGIDISAVSLDEASEQMKPFPRCAFSPIKIEADSPESVLGQIEMPADLFLCTYVFELLPTTQYCVRVLKLAFELLRPGGVAVVQIRYSGRGVRNRSRPWGYKRNMTSMVTFEVDEFWAATRKIGFEPQFVTLLPRQPRLNEERYAYFALQKPASV